MADNSQFVVQLLSLNDSYEIRLFADFNQDGFIDQSGEDFESFSFSGTRNGGSLQLPKGEYFARVRTGVRSRDIPYSLSLTPNFVPSTVPVDPGSGFSTAFDLGRLSTRRILQEYTGRTLDPLDFYKFTLPTNANLALAFGGLGGFSARDVELIEDTNNNGIFDGADITFFRTSISLSTSSLDVPQGTYFVRVDAFDSLYTLSLNPLLRPGNTRQEPGDLLESALNLGPLSGRRVLRDYVGVLDPVDTYRIRLTEVSDLNITRRVGDSSLDFALIQDANGNGVIDRGETLRSTSFLSTFSLEALDPGTYYIQLSGPTTNYDVLLSQTPNRSGDDLLIGTPNRDILLGEQGNDRMFGLGGNDTLLGGAGNDLTNGGAGNDVLLGGFGNDILIGGPGNDILRGNADNDVLVGDAGNDVFEGGNGRDVITTGFGRDIIRLGADLDIVRDFQNGQDRIFLGSIPFNQLRLRQVGTSVLVEQGARDLLLLQQTSLSVINRADFI